MARPRTTRFILLRDLFDPASAQSFLINFNDLDNLNSGTLWLCSVSYVPGTMLFLYFGQ